jgi:F0F1-type ATP synthase epsilon subunit
MTTPTLQTTFASPTKTLLVSPMASVLFLSGGGFVEVKPEHQTMFFTLESGPIKFVGTDGSAVVFYANQGAVSMENNICSVVAETVYTAEALGALDTATLETLPNIPFTQTFISTGKL